MIGIDTNVLIRYFVRDDEHQYAIAEKVLVGQCSREHPGLINRIVLCELVWVLESAYQCSRTEIAGIVRAMFQTAELMIEDTALAWQALHDYEDNHFDFADALLFITNHHQGCEHTLTLDPKAARLPTGFELR